MQISIQAEIYKTFYEGLEHVVLEDIEPYDLTCAFEGAENLESIYSQFKTFFRNESNSTKHLRKSNFGFRTRFK